MEIVVQDSQGKTRNFPKTAAGIAQAQAYSDSIGGRILGGEQALSGNIVPQDEAMRFSSSGGDPRAISASEINKPLAAPMGYGMTPADMIAHEQSGMPMNLPPREVMVREATVERSPVMAADARRVLSTQEDPKKLVSYLRELPPEVQAVVAKDFRRKIGDLMAIRNQTENGTN